MMIMIIASGISWFVAKSMEEDASWLVLETQLSAPRFPTTPTTVSSVTGGGSEQPPTTALGGPTAASATTDQLSPSLNKSTDVFGSYPSPWTPHHDVRIIRQSSRFIEAFRSSSPIGPNPLGDLLFEAAPITSSPPEMARSRMIVAPLTTHKKAHPKIVAGSQTTNNTMFSLSSHFESYLAIILETAKAKLGKI